MKKSIKTDDPHKQDHAQRGHFSFRINLFFFCTFVLFSILIMRLAILQFVDGKQLAAEKNLTTNRAMPIPPIRGNIFDKDGYPIAFTSPVQSLFFRIESGQNNKDEVIALANRMADVFEQYGKKGKEALTAAEIIKLMDVGYDLNKNKTTQPSYYSVPRRIKADLSKEEMAYLLEHRDEFKWLEVMEESLRTYDTNTVAVQLVGYMRQFSTAREDRSGLAFYKNKENTKEYLDTEDVGFDGLEQLYQAELRGKNGYKTYPVNASQKIIGKVTVTPPQKGDNLYLTIQKDVQLTAEKAIMDQLEFMRSSAAKATMYGYAPNARSGYAVAMEVKTGKVIAMASMPDYDPNVWTGGISLNEYKKIQPFVNNGTITTAYPDYPEDEIKKHLPSIVYMGSTIKPLSVLIGLNEGLFKVNDVYNDVGSFSFGKQGTQATIWNSDRRAWGPIHAQEAIEHSSNTFMSAMVGNNLYFNVKNGIDVWDSYLKKFGLGVLTGSRLANEIAGISEYKDNAKTDSLQSALIRASWGQNEKYTTLQLAQYATTLANRGKRMRPLFIDKITNYDGELVKTIDPEVLNQDTYPDEYWNAIFKGMKAVSKQGFEGFNYTVAAKTGTSTQKINGKDVDNAVFIAFAPIENPTLAIAVVVPEGGYGSWNAAPIARKMFDAYDQFVGLDGFPKGASPTPAKPAS